MDMHEEDEAARAARSSTSQKQGSPWSRTAVEINSLQRGVAPSPGQRRLECLWCAVARLSFILLHHPLHLLGASASKKKAHLGSKVAELGRVLRGRAAGIGPCADRATKEMVICMQSD